MHLHQRIPPIGFAAMGVAALAVLATWSLNPPVPTDRDWLVMTLVAGLSAVAYRFPVQVASKRLVVLDAALHALALLTLSPVLAALASGGGAALGTVVRRRWFSPLFNCAQVSLSVLLAACAYHTTTALWDTTLGAVVGVLLAGAVLYIIGALAVGIAMLVQGTRSPLESRLWNHVQAFGAHIVLVAAGSAIATTAYDQPWLIVFAVLPVAVLRWVMERTTRFDAGVLATAERIALTVEQAHPHLAGRAARVAALAYAVAQRAGLPDDACDAVALAARLHDVPASSLPAEVILNAETRGGRQRLYHEQHADQVAEFAGRTLRLPSVAAVLRRHHARFDGRGDPCGLGGHDIPIESRILAMCDAWVNLMSPNPIRPPLDEAAAAMMLRAGAGVQWDPRLVGLLLKTVFDDDAIELADFEEGRSAELAG